MCRGKKTLLWGLFVATISFVVVAGWITEVQTQEKYPTRAIDIICPFSPGGATDLSNRIIAAYLNKKWGVPLNVVNKSGGNTVPASLEVYRAVPDGYTLLGDSLPSISMLEMLVKSLPFKVMDRSFVALYASGPIIMIVPASSSVKDMKDLVAEAKRNPEGFTWTSLGGAVPQDLSARQFCRAIGIDFKKTRPVVSQGGAQAAVLTAGGHVVLGLPASSSALPAIKAGTVRPIAVVGKDRLSELPDVPTTAELGYPAVNTSQRLGISGPPRLPSHIVDIWDKALQEIIRDPEIISKFKNIGLLPFYHNANATIEMVKAEIEEVNALWGLK